MIKSPIKYAIALAVGVFAFGTLGFMFIMRWSLLDSMYMTMITLTTVGFSEVHQLDPAGRVFTMVLIGAGVFTLAFTVQVVIKTVVEQNLIGNFGRNRMLKRLSALNNHIIVCGLGNIGQHVVGALKAGDVPVVAIDKDAPENSNDAKVIYLRGDATDEELLKTAGLERAGVLVAVVGSDADNLYITMTARGINGNIRIISRAADISARTKLLRAGADSVALPYEIGGRRIAAMVLQPSVCEFLDMTIAATGEELRIAEVVIRAGDWLAGKDMLAADIRKRSGVIVLAVKKVDGRMISNPSTDLVFESGDTLLSLGTSGQIESAKKLAASGH